MSLKKWPHSKVKSMKAEKSICILNSWACARAQVRACVCSCVCAVTTLSGTNPKRNVQTHRSLDCPGIVYIPDTARSRCFTGSWSRISPTLAPTSLHVGFKRRQMCTESVTSILHRAKCDYLSFPLSVSISELPTLGVKTIYKPNGKEGFP